jgi:hypothetical protein
MSERGSRRGEEEKKTVSKMMKNSLATTRETMKIA